MRRTRACLALLATLSALPPAAQAQQQVPDAGRTLRETQQPAPAPFRPAPPAPRIETPERPALTAPAAARFYVKTFRVTGSTAFSAARLEQLLQDLAGHEFGLAELQEAAARITRFYREQGYPVARAYLPAQDVRDGVVEIAVLEGRYGRIELNNRSRVKDEVVLRHLAPLAPGAVIEDKPLERSLLLLYDLAGVAAPGAAPRQDAAENEPLTLRMAPAPGGVVTDATLRPGASTGESDLAVSLAPSPFASGSAELDNYGNRYTGEWRASGSFVLASPTGYGDLFSARLSSTGAGLTTARLAYQLPVGGDGLRLGAAYSSTDYQIGKSFSALDASGNARVATLSASYPFVRSLGINLSGQIAFDDKRLEDRLGATGVVTPKRNDGVTAGLSGTSTDMARNAASSFSLAAVSGRLRLDSAQAQIADDAGPRTSGSFNKWNYALSRLQQIRGPLSGFASISGQRAGKNLDSSEHFLLGGPFGVRAYPQGEAAGDDGFVFTAELRYRVQHAWAEGMELVALFDYGESRIEHQAPASGSNRRTLSGAGLGMNFSSGSDWLLRAAWSWHTGREPATSDTPRSGRGWLQLAKFF
jgi:hemolysin activation/secretion protein